MLNPFKDLIPFDNTEGLTNLKVKRGKIVAAFGVNSNTNLSSDFKSSMLFKGKFLEARDKSSMEKNLLGYGESVLNFIGGKSLASTLPGGIPRQFKKGDVGVALASIIPYGKGFSLINKLRTIEEMSRLSHGPHQFSMIEYLSKKIENPKSVEELRKFRKVDPVFERKTVFHSTNEELPYRSGVHVGTLRAALDRLNAKSVGKAAQLHTGTIETHPSRVYPYTLSDVSANKYHSYWRDIKSMLTEGDVPSTPGNIRKVLKNREKRYASGERNIYIGDTEKIKRNDLINFDLFPYTNRIEDRGNISYYLTNPKQFESSLYTESPALGSMVKGASIAPTEINRMAGKLTLPTSVTTGPKLAEWIQKKILEFASVLSEAELSHLSDALWNKNVSKIQSLPF